MTSVRDIEEQFGPDYDVDSATLKKFRRQSKSGLKTLPAAERRAYGTAVEAAILSKQRSNLARVSGPLRAECASGTFHSDGAKIIAAVKSQQRAALAACPGMERRARKPEEWQSLYDEAMKLKRT